MDSLGYIKNIEGQFELLKKQEHEDFEKEIENLLGYFHQRDGVKHRDGSWGTVAISPKQFKDCIAYFINSYADYVG